MDLESDSKNEGFELEFNDEFDMNEYKCLEIDSDLLHDLSNGKLEIRGNDNEEAVLVTSNKTFKIRQADFSNTQLLLLPEESSDDFSFEPTRVITGAISCHFVLASQQPRVGCLREILCKNLYKGEENENEDESEALLEEDYDIFDLMEQDHNNPKRNEKNIDLSLESLKNMIQASDKEILDALHDLDAIEINGQWRLLDSEYLIECFEDCINAITGANWSYDKINTNALHKLICEDEEIEGDYPNEIIEHVIAMHSVRKDETMSEKTKELNENDEIEKKDYEKEKEKENEKVYRLDVDKVCLFIGKQILVNKGKNGKMNKQEFIMEWKNTVPVDLRVNCKLELLIGHALISNDSKSLINGNQAIIELFEEKELSSDPKRRFEQLFEKRTEWTMDEIEPYLKILVKAGVKVDKYVRTVRKRDKDNNEYRVFASRNARV